METKIKTAADIMVPLNSYVTINEETTLYEAIKELQAAMHNEDGAWHGHRSVLVLGEGDTLVGILTMLGLLRAAGLRELDNDPHLKADSWGWYYIDKMREESKVRVKDIMRPLELVAVDARAPLSEVALTLLKHRVNSLPVIKDKKPVGIVRTIDIFMVMDEYFF